MNQQGLSLIIIIVIMSVTGLLLGLGLSLRGIGELELAVVSDDIEQNRMAADGCHDEALRQLLRTSSYTGGTTTLGSATCEIAVSGAGSIKTITVTSTIAEYTSVVQSQVDISTSPMDVLSWDE